MESAVRGAFFIMKRILLFSFLISTLSGCALITVPVKVVGKAAVVTGKVTGKAVVATGKAIVPNGDDDDGIEVSE